ncbi:mannose-1-phosphate guanylyltransferase/mannose-6-phosphate isomerase [Acidovorax sp. FJL06]|uniref:mannose-1-phosphate guanylyltransferase/mannose-6-phosphate isomerase n=1 Tax=Acidovorax sp. FJL06 TaxID=2153365 RepID=UPI000F56C46F|nr:mannose-1-phosphate guanylyltransferase/mannose-6-phosphate isomerase [Acidovorax sp. FJL06]RQO80782.1 mannose-1-phosphate guanylyltransferase/mannose-6-phosphate isomerase [Acidovorax sp. FJL06]
MKIQPVVLSGGAGTRLWPLSREDHPKQFLSIFEKESLFQKTVRRTLDAGGGDFLPPIVVGNEMHRFIMAEQLRQLDVDATLLLETDRKNTAPALTLAALFSLEQGCDAPMLVMPADHLIEDAEVFQSAVSRSFDFANDGRIVTFGIEPAHPETGYGYIRRGECHPQGGYFISRFVEKPDVQNAMAFCKDGQHFWNSGIFLLKPSVWLDALATCEPEILAVCEKAWSARSRDGCFLRANAGVFSECKSKSIDFAVMDYLGESAHHMLPEGIVVPLGTGWSDVGAWSALGEVLHADERGNAAHGDVRFTRTDSTLAIATSRLVMCVGVRDLVVVETPDAVLVMSKGDVQEIKNEVEKLNFEGRVEGSKHRKKYRPWGWYDTVDAGTQFQVKRLVVKPGGALSLQMHLHRAEHWVVVQGVARVTKGEAVVVLSENESTYIPQGVLHRLENVGEGELEIVEVQSGKYLGEDDIVRFDDMYGRALATNS